MAEGNPFSIVMVDLDDFKSVNDTLGHQAGDGLLRDIASGLVAAGRSMDLVFRYGGDEFALILPNTDGSGAAPGGRTRPRGRRADRRSGLTLGGRRRGRVRVRRDRHVPRSTAGPPRRCCSRRTGPLRGKALGPGPDRDGRGRPVAGRGVLAPGADAGRSADNERDRLTPRRVRHPGPPPAVRSHMSRATGRRPLGIASATSFLVLLLVVACVPQPAGRRTAPPIAATAAGVTLLPSARRRPAPPQA